MRVLGELNFEQCGNGVKVKTSKSPYGCVDIMVGDSNIWLIMGKEQAKALKQKLEEELEDE